MCKPVDTAGSTHPCPPHACFAPVPGYVIGEPPPFHFAKAPEQPLRCSLCYVGVGGGGVDALGDIFGGELAMVDSLDLFVGLAGHLGFVLDSTCP